MVKAPDKNVVRWTAEYGPAFIAGLINVLTLVIGGTAVWTALQSDVRSAKAEIIELKNSVAVSNDNYSKHETRIVKTETAIQFIVPSLNRIETKLDKVISDK